MATKKKDGMDQVLTLVLVYSGEKLNGKKEEHQQHDLALESGFAKTKGAETHGIRKWSLPCDRDP